MYKLWAVVEKIKQFNPYNPLHLAVRLVASRVHRLEYDPVTQFKFHFFFTWFWFLTLCSVPWISKLYGRNLGVLIIEEVSLWANFVSHMTALGSAIAGIFASGREREIPGVAAMKPIVAHNIVRHGNVKARNLEAAQVPISDSNARVFSSDLSHTAEFSD